MEFDWQAAGFSAAVAVHALKVMRMRAWDVVREFYANRGAVPATRAALPHRGARWSER